MRKETEAFNCESKDTENQTVTACSLCDGNCEACHYADACQVYLGTGQEVAKVREGWSV